MGDGTGESSVPGAAVATATVRQRRDLETQLRRLGLTPDVPVIVLIGGASGLDGPEAAAAERVIRWGVAPVAVELGAVVVDGGTDAGVMRMAGAARHELGAAFQLVGVAAESLLLTHPDADHPRAFPEPNHSYLVVVPGSDWGDETPWLFDVAQWIAGSRPILTVLVNGGPVARAELEESIRRGIPAIAIRGTGRAADDLSVQGSRDASADAEGSGDASPASYDSRLIHVADAGNVEGLREALGDALRGTPWTRW